MNCNNTQKIIKKNSPMHEIIEAFAYGPASGLWRQVYEIQRVNI